MFHNVSSTTVQQQLNVNITGKYESKNDYADHCSQLTSIGTIIMHENHQFPANVV